MANAVSSGQGTTIISASAVTDMVHKATGLPSTFFVAVSKAKINADGSLQANYTFDSSGQPVPPATVLAADEPQAEPQAADG